MNRYIKASNGSVIVNDLCNDHCFSCIERNAANGYAHIECHIDKKQKRLALYKSNAGCLYCCSEEAKTTKLFKSEVDSIGATIKALSELYSTIVNESSSRALQETSGRIDRVVHNLRSINAHAIQELYSVIPQENLLYDIKETANIVKKHIEADSHRAAITFLKIAKLNTSIKAEFSIYDKLLKGKPKLDLRSHNTRDIIMIVLYPFFYDFNEVNVRVDVQDYYAKTKVDFESFQVAIYHLVENASKYIMPNSTADIRIKDTPTLHIIEFDMCSLYISPDEENDIFKEGYSGAQARKAGKAGNGIGMYRAKKLIELNNGNIEFESGEIVNSIDGIDYAKNKIIITIAR